MEKMIKKYVRDEKGHRIGMVVAIASGKVGWSSMNKKDVWNPDKGHMIALNRAKNGYKAQVPSWMKDEVEHMVDRSQRYFDPANFSRKALNK